jgi:hypothetical protein
MQVLLGWENMVNEALGQPLKLEPVLLAARPPPKRNARTFWGRRLPQIGRRDQTQSACWSCGVNQATSGVTAPTEVRMKATTSTGNEMKDLRDTREQARWSEWRPGKTERQAGGGANHWEMSGCQMERGNAGMHIKASHHVLTVITERANPILVALGWVGERPCLVTIDTGECVAVTRLDFASRLSKRQPNQYYTL